MSESGADRSARTPAEPPPAAEQVAAYRQALERLMAGCLDRLARTPVPADTEPLETWRPGD
jgi:hypothetical protein